MNNDRIDFLMPRIGEFTGNLQNFHMNDKGLISCGFFVQEVFRFIDFNNLNPKSLEEFQNCAANFVNALLPVVDRDIIGIMNSIMDDDFFARVILFFDYQRDAPYFCKTKADFLEKIDAVAFGDLYQKDRFLVEASALGMDKAVGAIAIIVGVNTVNANWQDVIPLHIAVILGHNNVVETLINIWSQTPELLKRAIKMEDSKHKPAIYYAALAFNPDLVKLLIDNGAVEDMIDGAGYLYLLASTQDAKAISYLEDFEKEFRLKKFGQEKTTVAHLIASCGEHYFWYFLFGDESEIQPDVIREELLREDSSGFSVMERFLEADYDTDVRELFNYIGVSNLLEDIVWAAVDNIRKKFLPSNFILEAIKEYFGNVPKFAQKLESLERLNKNPNELESYFQQRLDRLQVEFANVSSLQEAYHFFYDCNSLFKQIKGYDTYPDSSVVNNFLEFVNGDKIKNAITLIPDCREKEILQGFLEILVKDLEDLKSPSTSPSTPRSDSVQVNVGGQVVY